MNMAGCARSLGRSAITLATTGATVYGVQSSLRRHEPARQGVLPDSSGSFLPAWPSAPPTFLPHTSASETASPDSATAKQAPPSDKEAAVPTTSVQGSALLIQLLKDEAEEEAEDERSSLTQGSSSETEMTLSPPGSLRASLAETREELRQLGMEAEASLYLRIGVALLQDGLAAEGVENLRRAEAAGSAEACFNLGLAAEKGLGCGQNSAEAVRWWRRGAERGHPGCAYQFGVCLLRGHGGLVKSETEAMVWIRKAAEASFGPACTLLGARELRMEKDPERARHWLQRGSGPMARALLDEIQDDHSTSSSLTTSSLPSTSSEEYKVSPTAQLRPN